MRLNFSGVGEPLIREGIRRLGEVVREQVALYGTLTGAYPAGQPARRAPRTSPARRATPGGVASSPPASPPPASTPAAAEEQLANVLQLPRKRA
jgi:hypothetical protein